MLPEEWSEASLGFTIGSYPGRLHLPKSLQICDISIF